MPKTYPTRSIEIILISDQKSTHTDVQAFIEQSTVEASLTLSHQHSEDFLKEAISPTWDVMFIDDRLDATKSLELLEVAHQRFPYLSKVILTRKSDRQRAVEAMKLGASDYLFKRDLGQDTFDRSIKHAVNYSEQQRQLEQRNAVIDALFDQAEEAMFLVDLEGNFILSNHVFQSSFGSSDAEQSFGQFLRKTLNTTSLDELLESTLQKTIEVEAKHEDGVTRFWRIHLKRIDLQGRFERVLGVLTDVSSEKSAERQRARSERLELTSRMAQILAHEIRNPLTNIRLSADYLQETYGEEDELVAYSEIIERNVARIDGLIQRLLQSVKPFEIKREQHDLRQFMDYLEEQTKDRQELLEAMVDFELATDTAKWSVDADKLELALLNLINNAFEAMMNVENPKLFLRIFQDADHLVLSIKDNGKGMSEEEQGRIFEAFYSNRKGGMGLGMMMVQNIIEGHKGSIAVESKPGKGTEFIIRLPEV